MTGSVLRKDKLKRSRKSSKEGVDEINCSVQRGNEHKRARKSKRKDQDSPKNMNNADLRGDKPKKARKSKRKDHNSAEEVTISVQRDVLDEIYQISSGDEDCSKGMKKWINQYYENRLGLEVLQQRIDDFITSHEEQEEQARKDREAKIAEDGWTVVVHRKGGKKTSDPESGVAVGSVSQGAVLHNMDRKKTKEVGLDFYRFQRREAQRSEVMKLQSKFEEDKKRIQQLRAARKSLQQFRYDSQPISRLPSTSVPFSSRVHRNPSRCISCCFDGPNRCPRLTGAKGNTHGGGEGVGFRVGAKGKGKDNVWSIDNELAKEVSEKENRSRRKRRQGGRRAKKFNDSKVMVSAAMLIELENVLQTQEPVIRPSWNTFVSSVSGIWKGVGAVFSPITAKMEPIEVGSKNEHLFDCYTLSRVEGVPDREGGTSSRIQRKINWVTLNPHGELLQQDDKKKGDDSNFTIKGVTNGGKSNYAVPTFESFDFTRSDVMEEDFMDMEPGLVYFEDGSYSRGPVDIPVGNVDGSEYYLSPTYKFEQCLVKGCHKRLRIVHTIEFSNGGADIQILRVAVYEEQWDSPAKIDDHSNIELDVKPFSQRKRTCPSELTGSWKVFEVSATPIYGDDTLIDDGNSSPYVYFCMETVKKRSFPESRGYFGEEEMMDMQDVAVLWLPGGVTSYVDISKDGILCIGVGWYSDEGIHLVMERDYGTDGKLIEVRSKSEVKRRWPDQLLG
ncbi:hypothetical protein V2J09_018234 [Rumex salicifolius]